MKIVYKSLFCLLLTCSALGHTVFASSAAPNKKVEDTCSPIPSNIGIPGPTLTVAQVEAESLAKVKAIPGSVKVPLVPFGYANSHWVSLKKLIIPGDTLHKYQTDNNGGYLVLRKHCFIGQILEWSR